MSALIPEPAATSRTPTAMPGEEARGLLFGMAAAVIWGSYMALARAGVTSGLTASDITFIRYAAAGLIMLPWLMRNGIRDFAGVGYGRATILALLAGPIFMLAGVGGYAYAPLAHGAVLQPAAVTICSLVLAAILLGERPGITRIIGLVMMLGGLACIAGPSLLESGSLTPLGDAMFLTAGLLWAVFTIACKIWGINPLAATAAISVISAVVYVPLYLIFVGPARLLAADPGMLLAQFLVQGVLSGVVAVIAFSRSVQLIGAARAAIFPALVPAAATVLGVPIAREWPTPLQMTGVAVVSIGLFFAIGLIRRGRPPFGP